MTTKGFGGYDDLFGYKGSTGDSGWSSTPIGPRCYESHKALPLGDFEVFGGSASYPEVKDADIYVALQDHSSCGLVSDPWEPQEVIEIQFGINDMGCPKVAEVGRFKKMITYLWEQIQLGKKVHVGCIGGHGRTGMVLSALVAEATGNKDAIKFVRKNYCKKAVETEKQIAFLIKHYGVTTAHATKETVSKTKYPALTSGSSYTSTPGWLEGESKKPKPVLAKGATGTGRTIEPLEDTKRNIWNPNNSVRS